MLQVKKVAENLYEVLATPPEVAEAWSAKVPIGANELISQLYNRGCHTTDIADALNVQDPDWGAKAQSSCPWLRAATSTTPKRREVAARCPRPRF
jgi:hypothetical protein